VSYAKESRELPFFADVESNIATGFIVMKETSKYAVEICVMGVKKEYAIVWALAVNFLKRFISMRKGRDMSLSR